MNIRPRDWRKLSTYLDGELTPGERSKLEHRLKDEPGLRAALGDLRKMKMILSRTPQLDVPRNFTLTPEMAGIPIRRSVSRPYRLAAAVLSLLFIAVVIFDFSSSVFQGGAPAVLAPRSEDVMMEALPEAAEEEAVLESMEESTQLSAEEAEIPAEEQEMDAPAAEAELAPESTGVDNLAQEEYAEEEEGALTKDAPEEPDRAGEGQTEDGEMSGDEAASQLVPTAGVEEESTFEQPDQEIGPSSIPSRIPWLLVLEIILGLAALLFAGAAWVRRRS